MSGHTDTHKKTSKGGGHSSGTSHDKLHKSGEDALTKALTGEGSLLGIPIPKEMSFLVQGLVNNAINFANIKAIQACKDHLPQEQTWARVVTAGVGYAIPLAPQLITLGKKVSNYFSTVNELDAEMRPLFNANYKAQSGWQRLFGGSEKHDNAIIKFARDQLTGVCRNDMLATSAHMFVAAAPPLLEAHSRLNPDFKNPLRTAKDWFEDNMKTMNEAAGGHGNGHGGHAHLKGPGFMQWDQFLSGGAGQMVGEKIRKSYKESHEEFDGKSAWKDCLKFRTELNSFLQQAPNLSESSRKRSEQQLTTMVKDVFKRRFVESGWDEMNQASEEMLDEIMPQLMKPFLSGQLDGFALVNLAGEDSIVRNDGKYVANEIELQTAIDEQLTKLSRDNMMDPKDYFAGVSFQLKDVVHAAKDLTDNEKAFFSMILPATVLKAAGMDDEQVKNFRAEGHDKFMEQMADYVVHLNEKDVDDLKHMQLTKPDIAFIGKMADYIAQHGTDGLEQYAEEAKRLIATTAVQSPSSFREALEQEGKHRTHHANHVAKHGESKGTAADAHSDKETHSHTAKILAEKAARDVEKHDRVATSHHEPAGHGHGGR